MAKRKHQANEPAGTLSEPRKRIASTTLAEVIAQYGTLTDPPGPGEKVLFECAGDYTGASISLGEVVATWPVQRPPTATVLVMGIRTYFPNGKQPAFRGKSRRAFPATHVMRPIEERFFAHALRREQRAADTREGVESLRGQARDRPTMQAGETNFAEPPDNILPFSGLVSKT